MRLLPGALARRRRRRRGAAASLAAALIALALLPGTGAAFTGTAANVGNELSVASFFTSYQAVAAGDAAGGLTGTVDLTPYRSPQPVPVSGDPEWSRIDGGDHAFCGIATDARLWCWGLNGGGQLGLGDTSDRHVATRVDDGGQYASVSLGPTHGCGIRLDATLWCWGDNGDGQLGVGDASPRLTPTQVVGTGWASVSAGDGFTCGTRTSGSLWCWGRGNAELGLGAAGPDVPAPQQVGADTDWSEVDAGSAHACATKTGGTLWCWGWNIAGQVGDGTTTTRYIPTQVGADQDWSLPRAGLQISCALRAGGALWCWGANASGQLGDGTTTERHVPTSIGTPGWEEVVLSELGYTACGRRSDRSVWCWGSGSHGQIGDGLLSQRHVPTATLTTDADALAVAASTACAVRSAGAAACWGDGANGARGANSTSSSPIPQPLLPRGWPSMALGSTSSCAIRADGTLWCWGDNSWYRLGDGPDTSVRHVPTRIGAASTWREVSVGESHGCATRLDSTLWCWGADVSASIPDGAVSTLRPSPHQIGAATDWGAISVGVDLGCGLRGVDLWCWGYRAGNGGPGPEQAPVQVAPGASWTSVSANSSGHACATRADGTLWCWGENSDGQLGVGDTSARLVPSQVGAAANWVRVGVGRWHSCATRTDGTLWCWGRNASGQLGLGTTSAPISSPTQVGAATSWAVPQGGGAHTCATRTNGTLWCWGSNPRGQLGLGSATVAEAAPVQVGVAADWGQRVALGVAHTCGARADAVLRCWGRTWFNQTGHGLQELAPGPIASAWGALDLGRYGGCGIRDVGTLWCWGDNFAGQLGTGSTGVPESRPVQVGTGTTWRDVSAGTAHACGIRGDRSLWCWGGNASGQLGDGSYANRNAPTRVGTANDWRQVSAGNTSTCATRVDGSLWCWGANGEGQLGTGGAAVTSPQQVGGTTWGAVAVGTAHACATRTDGTLWCWGSGEAGRLGDGTSTNRPTPTQVGVATTWAVVAAGERHTCATRTDGTLWCWGGNGWFQLGDSTMTDRPSPVQVGAATDWTVPAAGSYHSCAIRAGGTAWCWGGLNVHGELGSGTTIPSAAPTQVSGVTSAVGVSVGTSTSGFLVG